MLMVLVFSGLVSAEWKVYARGTRVKKINYHNKQYALFFIQQVYTISCLVTLCVS